MLLLCFHNISINAVTLAQLSIPVVTYVAFHVPNTYSNLQGPVGPTMEDEKELDQIGEVFANAPMPTGRARAGKDPRCEHCSKCGGCLWCSIHWACKYCSYSCMTTGEPVYCKDPAHCG